MIGSPILSDMNMIKPGVDLRGLSAVWGVAYPMIQKTFEEYGYACIVTSANDGTHLPNSLHYKGKALDFRTKHMAVMDKAKVIEAIRAVLGAQFDLVFESVGLPNEHAHIEFDPKETSTEHV